MTSPKSLLAAATASAAQTTAVRRDERAPATRARHDRMANAVRALAMDAVEQAKSGHPGLPMGAADVATVLFTRFLKFDAANPAWPDRDRFVLSAGHGSMLIYALLYLLGYEKMTIEEIKRFRQLGSMTPGHPESFVTPGIETTTGPLGQGLANAVGMARCRSIRPRARGPSHLCARLRRRSDGGREPGGDRARWASQAQQADCVVRRQHHLDRRSAVAFGLRQSRQALRGRRLGGDTRRRARSRGDRQSAGEGAGERSALAHRLPHHHRLRRAEQGGDGEVPRLSARRR